MQILFRERSVGIQRQEQRSQEGVARKFGKILLWYYTIDICLS